MLESVIDVVFYIGTGNKIYIAVIIETVLNSDHVHRFKHFPQIFVLSRRLPMQ